MRLPPLSEFYGGYGSYHNNLVNKLIHMICIPLLFTTAVGMLTFIDCQLMFNNTIMSINIGTLFYLILMAVYIKIDIFAGIISTLFYGFTVLYTNHSFFINY